VKGKVYANNRREHKLSTRYSEI